MRLITLRVAAFALGAWLIAAAPALADAHPLHLGATAVQFTSFNCLDDSCSLAQGTTVGNATSNLATGVGTMQGTLIVDFSPGGNCNIVDESDTFTFEEGTIVVHSHHEDCATQGLRIDTPFEVTDGTGSFTGATGNGREFAARAAALTITFNGTISI